MRLYRLGSTGEPIRDIQDRLSALGHEIAPDDRGVFGDGTRAAVAAFQSAKGLEPDGIVGPDTWRVLYEAGYRLGDRLLFLRRPMLRGEDVLELQLRLNALGFDAGKPDGVFGPDTEKAVLDFQQNRTLSEDGVAGPEVLAELALITRGPIRSRREAIREQELLRGLPRSVTGTKVSFDPGARTPDEAVRAWSAAATAAVELQTRGGIPIVSRSVDERLPERLRALRANRAAADLIVSFHLGTSGESCVFFFETTAIRSEAGQALAVAVAGRLGYPTAGRAGAILRETRAPAILVVSADLGAPVGKATVDGIADFLASLDGAP